MEYLLKRYLRIILLTVIGSITIYALFNLVCSWLYTYFLTHPPCSIPIPLSDNYLYEEVWLHTMDDHEIRVWYYPPRNKIVIISLGGVEGSLGNRLPPVSFLLDNGYGILQIDSRTCAKPHAKVTLGANEILDAEAALLFLRDKTEVERIGIFGYSMGAATAIRLAARHREIASVIAEGGFFNLGNDIVEPEVSLSFPHRFFLYSIAYTFWVNTKVNPWEISPIDDINNISPRPILLIFGEHEVTSAHAYEQYHAARESKYLWIVPNGEQGNNHAINPVEYQKRVISFVEHSLGR